MSPCFLFLVWTVSQVFSTPILLRLFVILSESHYSSQIFRVFLLPIFHKQEFFPPTRDLNPWPLDYKSNALPTELAGLEKRLVTLFPAVLANSLPSFLESFTSAANRDSVLFTLVNSYFLCYLAFNSVKRGFLGTHKRLEPLKFGLKDQRSID